LPKLKAKLHEIIDELFATRSRPRRLELIEAHGLHYSAGLTSVVIGEMLEGNINKRELRKFTEGRSSQIDMMLTDLRLQSKYRVRRKIPDELRKQVYERDGYCCVHCDSHENLSVDHAIPVIFEGPTELWNLQTLCSSCNSKKWCNVPDDVRASIPPEILTRAKPRGNYRPSSGRRN
jgi:5-methylcytosine-specific restriction endonuclease McrA